MSDLISRDVLFNEISNIINRHENKPLDVSWLVPSDGLIMALVSIFKAPAVDAIEVVFCKDCIYQKDAKVNCKGFIICPVSNMEITDDDYCSYGERRESEVIE